MKIYSKTLLFNVKALYCWLFVILLTGLLSPNVASATDFYIKGGNSEICEGDGHQYYYIHSRKYDRHDKYEWKIENNKSGAYIIGSRNKHDVKVHPGKYSGGYKLVCVIKRKKGWKYYNYYTYRHIIVNPRVYVDAGPDQEFCGLPDYVRLYGKIKNCRYGGVWTKVPGAASGYIRDAYKDWATYKPAPEDLVRGYADLKLTAQCYKGKCGISYDIVRIYFRQPATVNPGGPYVTCGRTPITLAGTVGGGATSGTWSVVTAGGGSFNGNVFTASEAFGAAGTDVVVRFTTNDPVGPCPAVSADVTIRVDQPATANAGPDQTVQVKKRRNGEFENVTVDLVGSIGGSATSGTWTTSGSGTFTPNATTVTADYIPSDADIRSGSVTLTLTTNDPNSGNVCPAASDAVVINFEIIKPAECYLELYAKVRKIKVDEYGDVITGGSIDLEVRGGSDYYEYKWFYNGYQISDEQDLYNLKHPGKYRVVVIDKRTGCRIVCRFVVKVKPLKPCGCNDDYDVTDEKGEEEAEDTATSAARVATSDVAENVSLTVFPNTVKSDATIQFTTDKATSYTVEVINSVGQVVKQVATGNSVAGKLVEYKLNGTLLELNKVNFIRVRTANKAQVFKVFRE